MLHLLVDSAVPSRTDMTIAIITQVAMRYCLGILLNITNLNFKFICKPRNRYHLHHKQTDDADCAVHVVPRLSLNRSSISSPFAMSASKTITLISEADTIIGA